LNNAKVIAQTLKKTGVSCVYLYPGGTIAPLLDELIKQGIQYICAKTEQGAGYMAIAAAKVLGEPQVVMVTSGPGVTNLITPVADAYYDSVPLLILTGQVGTSSVNTQKKLRQTGFQETDAVGLYKNITKKSYMATVDDDMGALVLESFMFAKTGRFGPVHLDLPMDVQKNEIEQSSNDFGIETSCINEIPENTWINLRTLISNASRPIILAGNGVILSSAVPAFRKMVEALCIPVVSSMPAVGVLAKTDQNYIGYIGHTGEYYANLTLQHSDLVLVLGSRLDLRQRGTEIDAFKKNKKIIRVDIDENELEHGEVTVDISIESDLNAFIEQFLKRDFPRKIGIECWMNKIANWKEKFSSSQFYNSEKLTGKSIIEKVSELSEDRDVVVTSGVGCHQQFVARYFNFDYPSRKWLTSSGHGTMGYDLPANLGAIINSSSSTLGLVFVGDGSIQMNIQELATLSELNLPVKIFVLDDASLNLVAQFQNMTWGSAPSTEKKLSPNFYRIAKAYGIDSYIIESNREVNDVLKRVLSNNKPCLVHCILKEKEDVLPMLLGGQKLSEMYPFNGEVFYE
jgi:acetolactate synthase-1/2/3 large subunit